MWRKSMSDLCHSSVPHLPARSTHQIVSVSDTCPRNPRVPCIHQHLTIFCSYGFGPGRIRPQGLLGEGHVALLTSVEVCVCVCAFLWGGEAGVCASLGCEAAQSNKSQLHSGGFSDVCGLDRALHGVHENFEERRGTKKTHTPERRGIWHVSTGLPVTGERWPWRHAGSFTSMRGRVQTMDLKGAPASTEPHWLTAASASNTFTLFFSPNFFFLFFLPVCRQPLMASFGRYLVFLMSLWVVVNEATWIRSIHMSEWVHKEVGTMSLSTWQWPELIWIKPQTCIAWEKSAVLFFK